MAISIKDIIKVSVIGIQHYGIFVRVVDDDEYTGLIHISEVSYDFVKDIKKFADVGDILYAKVLDVDHENKHVKLSIKATKPKNRYRYNKFKMKNDAKSFSFAPLSDKLPIWIQEQLKEKNSNDKS